MQAVFWISLVVLFYTYLGYGLLLLLLTAFIKRRVAAVDSPLPPLTIVIPAYKEEAVLQQKMENTFSLDYPTELLSVIVVTDGSSDESLAITKRFPRVLHLHHPERRGKSAAMNRAVAQVQTPVVVFTDANTLIEPQALRLLVRHFANSSVGGVSGEKRIWLRDFSLVGFGERLYWQYESFLKKANARFYTLVGAAGELFAIRTSLFRPLAEDIVLDDFVLSTQVCLQGYRFLYEAGAGSVEASSTSLNEERKRKVRISAGSYQALARLPQLLNFFAHPRLTFQYVSHRVLRWVACPLALPLLFVSNAVLVQTSGWYAFLFAGQLLFYILAFTAPILPLPSLGRLLLVPNYFLFMILSQYAGFLRAVRGGQPAAWEKVARQSFPQGS